MASLTDVVFLLIIFFLLTSTFVNPNALNLLLPSSQSKTTVNQPVSVSISADLKYYIGKQPVRLENMRSLLTEQLKGQKDATIVQVLSFLLVYFLCNLYFLYILMLLYPA